MPGWFFNPGTILVHLCSPDRLPIVIGIHKLYMESPSLIIRTVWFESINSAQKIHLAFVFLPGYGAGKQKRRRE